MVLAIVLPVAFALALIFHKKFEDTITLAIFLLTTVLYISGLITTFVPGIYITYLMALAGGVLFVYKAIKNWSEVKNSVFTAGLAGFLLLCVYFLFFSYGRYIEQVDDFIHWGIAVKHFYILNDFCDVPYTTDLAVEYPPFVPLWSYFTTKQWITCSTGMMYWGEHILLVSTVVQLLGVVKRKETKFGFLLCILFILTVPYWTGPYYQQYNYTLLRPDMLMAYVFFYILFNFAEYKRTGDKYYYFICAYAMFVLTLIKQSGIIQALLVCFIIMSVNIKTNTAMTRNVKMLVVAVLAIAAAYISWNAYSGRNGSAVIASAFLKKPAIARMVMMVVIVLSLVGCVLYIANRMGGAKFSSIYSKYRRFIPRIIIISYLCIVLIFMIIAQYSWEHINEYLRDVSIFFFDISEMYFGYIIKVPVYLFVISLVVFVGWIRKHNGNEENKYLFVVWEYTLWGLLMYILFRTVSRMLFQSHEYSLHSYDRYFLEYMSAVLIFAFYIACLYIKQDKQAICAILVITMLSNCSFAVSEVFDKKTKTNFRALQDVTFDYGDKVFLMDIVYSDDDRRELDFYYQIAPASMNEPYEENWYLQSDPENNRRLTLEEVSGKVLEGKYDYVYIRNIDYGFEEYYADLFENPEDIGSQHLYKVTKKGDLISMSLYK